MTILETQQLSKIYGSLTAVDSVDLELQSGQIVGLLGPNGSGKTTLIKMIAGLLTRSSGTLYIDGDLPGKNTKAKVAYLPDRDFLPSYMNTEQLLDLYEDFFADFDTLRAEAMLKDLGLDTTLPLKKMSKGTKEKVQLILTMSRKAKLYLLDEPIAGVDPATREYILKTIISNYDPDSVVLISTHLITDVESILDDIIFLQEGKIIIHKDADTLREEEGKSIDKLFREVFRC